MTTKNDVDLNEEWRPAGIGAVASAYLLSRKLQREPTRARLSAFRKSLLESGERLTPFQLWMRAQSQHQQQEARNPAVQLVAGTKTVSGKKVKYWLANDRGEVEELSRESSYEEDQSFSPDILVVEGSASLVDSSAPDRVRDVSLSINDRLAALQEWVAKDNDASAEFIASELCQETLATEWHIGLIYAADAVRFENPSVRVRAVDGLFKSVMNLRKCDAQGMSQVVWCAVHRIGSIIPVTRANELATFFDRSVIDTRLVTLQAIVRMFETTPPENTAPFGELANRAVRFAETHFDTDVFSPGEVSAIAIEGTIAAATLSDIRILNLIDLASQVGRAWLLRKLQSRLDELLRMWHDLPDQSPCKKHVEQARSRLNDLI